MGNSPGTGEFPTQMASNAENVSIWWRHHETYTWLTPGRRRSAYAVRQWMDDSDRIPYMQESSSNISSRERSISNQKGMMKHGYLLYVHDGLVIFLVPCLSRYPPFNALSTPSTCRSQTLSRPNLGNPRFNINHSNTIWRMARSPHISPIAAPVWFSSTHNLATWGILFALHVEQRTPDYCQVPLPQSNSSLYHTRLSNYNNLTQIILQTHNRQQPIHG